MLYRHRKIWNMRALLQQRSKVYRRWKDSGWKGREGTAEKEVAGRDGVGVGASPLLSHLSSFFPLSLDPNPTREPVHGLYSI